ncbi:alpha/beta hydrolase [Paraburkholderia sp. SUR17]|uniref:RBBP9/YdeN family alpha/beta hydrolase n=1 Tax=Paraburkholderia sp. SUR17 TaxID=3034358 RepID=UPI0024079C0E|nr:alpha/beta hydrolase [Paraburkholderia sp. SUR17]WEY39762.1 alpha/beta hydrolase [Paraburkholderia sp. SUR17]
MIDCTDHTVLTLPGYLNSGPGHWQTRWETLQGRHGPARGAVSGAPSGHFAFTRVQMADWDHPVREAWCRTLDEAIAAAEGPVLLAAHSMGCLTVAFWATQYATPERAAKVAGALLVAVPDPAGAVFPRDASGFSPVPLEPLPFPTTVVASSNDPYGGIAFSAACAQAWGSRWFDIGARGHINADSGLGDWEQGLAWLAELAREPRVEAGR